VTFSYLAHEPKVFLTGEEGIAKDGWLNTRPAEVTELLAIANRDLADCRSRVSVPIGG